MALCSATCAHAAGHPVVLELFTSQSCSSCPPADALLKQLSADDPDILPLSFHVHYWDHLSWKDTYSSSAYTDRQKAYAQALRASGIFTPQLIVNGTNSVVGSNAGDVRQAIASAKQTPPGVNISLAASPANHQLIATITANGKSVASAEADIWKVRFDPYAKTNIGAGENGGRTLESVNNVTSLKLLGTWRPTEGSKAIALDNVLSGGVAILIQAPHQGAILSAASYIKK